MMIELMGHGFAMVAAILSFIAGNRGHAGIDQVTSGLPVPANLGGILKSGRLHKPSNGFRHFCLNACRY
jgi:hypothetical protein